MSERDASAKGPRKVLIIGAGFAGLECAQKLANDSRFEVTIIDRNNHHLFQPLLYQVATASLAASDIARSIRQVLTKAKNVTVLMDEISAIDSDGKTANGKSGTVYHYDTLLLAAGARTGYFGRDEWAEHTLGLKTLAEAQTVRRTVLSNLEKAELTTDPEERKRLMTVVIIGGGPTGVELAGAFADLIHRSLKEDFRRIDTSKLRVLLLEGADRILAVYDPDQSAYTKDRLTKDGVEVLTSTKVVNISKGRAELEDGTVLESEAIIWAAGVAANPLTTMLGVPTDRGGRITPNPDLSLPGKPDIFVAGDLVAILDEKGKPVPGVAPAASQMGRHVAKVLKEDARLEKTQFSGDKASLRPKFSYWDKGFMAIIGKNHAVVKAGNMRVKGFIAWVMWLFIHILFLIGFRNKLSVLLGWAFSYIRDNPEARVIVNRPGSVAKQA
ncbi:NAD(P)/FAD-dependent oxidoreductase [Luteolibacter sp. LG18]|uniref:NAD(P)/FAD-dependent oxidoreductase n=1 Tax=Luteolibacter sp. LG18 TaxID=2819286 RepID=UPI0030C72E74